MEIRICYIDDEPDQAKRFGRILEASGNLKVVHKQPTPDIGAIVSSCATDLFLVDYELDRQLDDQHVNYTGSTLVTAIRERAPDYPIVLITRDSILDSRQKEELRSELRIDDVFYKGEIATEQKEGATDAFLFADKLIGLVRGFEALRSIPTEHRDWPALLGVLKVSSDESALILKASPPLYQNRGIPEWGVSRMAWWIRNTLLAFPGILYDPVYAATELRISVESFLLPEVQKLFDGAKYKGIFAPDDGRWWRESLWHTAMEYVQDKDFVDKFPEMFHRRTGIRLEPSISIVRGETPADTVCHILHEPVMYKYTLAYRPDNRPPIMDPARVSFTAIQQCYDQIQRIFLEGVDDEALNKIQEMEL